jgi:MFS family permease
MSRSRTTGARQPLSALIAAHAVSLLGNTVALIALPWFVLSTTGSATRTGIIAFFSTLPIALGSLSAGALVDRIGARRMSVLADAFSAVAVAAIPVLSAAGALSFWVLAALAFAGALFDGPGQAARQALLPQLAREAGVPLERANSLFTATEHVSYIAGAPLAGVLIAAIGAPATLWLDAGSFVVSGLAVLLVVPRMGGVAVAVSRRYIGDVLDGLWFVARDRVVTGFLFITMVGNLIMAALAPVILPVYAREVFDSPSRLGLMIAAYGVGGLAGTVAFGALSGRLTRRGFFTVALIGMPVSAAAITLLPPLAILLLALAVLGVCPGVLVPLRNTVLMERTPPALRGRLFSTLQAAQLAVVPFGMLATGLLLQAAGLTPALILFAAGLAAFATVSLLLPMAARLDEARTWVLVPEERSDAERDGRSGQERAA